MLRLSGEASYSPFSSGAHSVICMTAFSLSSESKMNPIRLATGAVLLAIDAAHVLLVAPLHVVRSF